MIKRLHIKNFKSIKELEINCHRINVLIGKPNTGKSNILEGLGLYSLPYCPNLKDLVRMEKPTDLFYDYDISNLIEVNTDIHKLTLRSKEGKFFIEGQDKNQSELWFKFHYDYEGTFGGSFSRDCPFRFYRFTLIREYTAPEAEFLLPLSGKNLFAILQSHKKLRELAADLFREYGYKLVLIPHEKKIQFQKEEANVVTSFPYFLASDTLQRIIFHLAAIETNNDAVIIFEEPEAHAFPFYTKYLAERISFDRGNQYFISTHNPYFLLPLLEKTPMEEIAVFIIDFKDFRTSAYEIPKSRIPELLDLNSAIFFNLDRFFQQ